MAERYKQEERRSRQKIQTIQLEPYDDVVSVRDRLQFTQMRRILLVFPDQGQILRRKLDLVLIQREAARRNLQIALLCGDTEVATNAASINMSCFFNTKQARSYRWKTPRNKVFVDRASRPRNTVQHPYELMHVASRLKPTVSNRQMRMQLLGRVLIGLVVAVTLIGLLLSVIPSATVTLTPATDAIYEPVTITADPVVTEIDMRGGLLPATVLRILVSGDSVTVQSTGRREASDTLAQGRVVLTNQSENPVFIPAGTIVSTGESPPARFRTAADVPLPAQIGATAEVEIIALTDTPALEGNVPAQAINRVEGELETIVSVSNSAPTFGGGIREEAVVTQADHDRLLTLAQGRVLSRGLNDLLLQLPGENKFLVPDSIRLVEERPEWTIFSASVGEAAESVTLDMRGVIEATVVDELQAQQLAFISLMQRLPEGSNVDDTSLTYRRADVGLDAQGRFTFQMFVEGNTLSAINIEAVAGRINGMTVSNAKRTLENELLLDPRHPPEIHQWPFNTGLMPLLPVRINVRINRP
jgi:hypothetical protein